MNDADADAAKARSAAIRYLRSHARDLADEDREELASDAYIKLLEKSRVLVIGDHEAYIVTLAQGLLANWRKRRDRQDAHAADLVETAGSAEDLIIGSENIEALRTGPPRFFPNDPALWPAVREACRAEFERRLGVPFPWDDAAALRFGQRTYLENEVRAVLSRVRDAMLDGRVLVARGRSASMGLLERVIGRLEGLDVLPLGPVAEGRSALVQRLDTFNVLDLPTNDDGSSRMLDPREYALVSLLCGNRPELKSKRQPHPDGWTIADVIGAERAAVSLTVQRHGVDWAADRRGTHTQADARCMGPEGGPLDTIGEEDSDEDEAPNSPGGSGGDPV